MDRSTRDLHRAAARLAAIVTGLACNTGDRLQSDQDDAARARGVDTRVSSYKDPQPPRTSPPPGPAPDARPAVEPDVAIDGQTRGDAIEGLSFRVPREWTRPDEPAPHLAYRLPGPGGDAALLIYTWPGDDAAFERWRARIERPRGEPDPKAELEIRAMVRGPLQITRIDAGGPGAARWLPDAAPAGVPDDRLFGALVERAGLRVFFAALGPAATMARWEQAFADFTVTFAVPAPP